MTVRDKHSARDHRNRDVALRGRQEREREREREID